MAQKIRVVGGPMLKGSIEISGAKNAALPLMAASLLTSDSLILENVPSSLADIHSMGELLQQHGVHVSQYLNKWEFKASSVSNTTAPYEFVSKLRASILVLGPLIARFNHAKVSLPGGCAIGTRPVDIHLKGLQELGVNIELSEGYIHAHAPFGLKGTRINMPIVTVTGTENLMMAAVLAKGETHLINAACEPEVVDLANCLMKMGAYIEGAGTDHIIIQGVETLNGATHSVMADRIEAGTYLIAALMTKGSITLNHYTSDLGPAVASVLKSTGAYFEDQKDKVIVCPSDVIKGVDLITEPFPGFATDLQAQFMALMSICSGASMITENIFENRFMHVPELCRMGANINVHGASAMVRGVPFLSGAEVMATDLRASVCLILAALVARGETILSRIYHLDRGYEHLEKKLSACGAIIERIDDSKKVIPLKIAA